MANEELYSLLAQAKSRSRIADALNTVGEGAAKTLGSYRTGLQAAKDARTQAYMQQPVGELGKALGIDPGTPMAFASEMAPLLKIKADTITPDQAGAQMAGLPPGTGPINKELYLKQYSEKQQNDRQQRSFDQQRDLVGTREDQNAKNVAAAYGRDLLPIKVNPMAAQKIAQNGAAQTAIKQFLSQPGGANPQQMTEAALGVASSMMGSSGGRVPAEMVNELMPKTVIGNANAFAQWLTNEPTGTGQQKFLQQYMDTLGRENTYWGKELRKSQRQVQSGYLPWKALKPDYFSAQEKPYGLDQPDPIENPNQSPAATPPTGPGNGMRVFANEDEANKAVAQGYVGPAMIAGRKAILHP